MRSLTVRKDGTTLDCAVFGRGSRALVLIPGLSFQRVRGAALPLAYMYRLFSKEYTVYVLDKKEEVPDGYTIRELAGDAAFAMEQLGLPPADVFGVSQGGMIAQYLAIDHPQFVHKLVLGVTGAASEEIAARLKCELYMYDDLGHAAYDEAPDFNRRIAQFLRERP